LQDQGGIVKIAVIGKSLTGKTSLSYAFMNKAIPEHDPTVEDTYKTTIDIKGNSVVLGIFYFFK